MIAYDLHNINVRHLEIFRGLFKALEMSHAGFDLKREVAQANGISELDEKMDEERYKIRLDGPYDAIIAMAGSFIQMFRRQQAALKPQWRAWVLMDLLQTLVLCLVDLKRLKSGYSEAFVDRIRQVVRDLSAPDAFTLPVVQVLPSGSRKEPFVVSTVLNGAFFC